MLVDGAEIAELDEKAAGDLGIGIVASGRLSGAAAFGRRNIFAGRQPTQWLGQVDVRAMRDPRKDADRLSLASPSIRP